VNVRDFFFYIKRSFEGLTSRGISEPRRFISYFYLLSFNEFETASSARITKSYLCHKERGAGTTEGKAVDRGRQLIKYNCAKQGIVPRAAQRTRTVAGWPVLMLPA